jgi:hypothetical protein
MGLGHAAIVNITRGLSWQCASRFAVCSPENKYFDGALAGMVFWGFLASWGVYWLAVADTPSHARSIGIKTLAGFFWQNIEGKRVRGKVLIALELGSLPRLVWIPGWAVLVRLTSSWARDPHFVPSKKSSLTKVRLGEGGPFLRRGFLGLRLELPRSGRRSLNGPPARHMNRLI